MLNAARKGRVWDFAYRQTSRRYRKRSRWTRSHRLCPTMGEVGHTNTHFRPAFGFCLPALSNQSSALVGKGLKRRCPDLPWVLFQCLYENQQSASRAQSVPLIW